MGGYDGASRQCLSTVERYDPGSNQWSFVADMSTRRSGAGTTALPLAGLPLTPAPCATSPPAPSSRLVKRGGVCVRVVLRCGRAQRAAVRGRGPRRAAGEEERGGVRPLGQRLEASLRHEHVSPKRR